MDQPIRINKFFTEQGICSRREADRLVESGAVTVNGKTYRMSPPFIVVATQNPIEQEGTYPLPEAQLDRFMLSIHVEYPGETDELSIAGRSIRGSSLQLQPVARKEEFATFIELIDQTQRRTPAHCGQRQTKGQRVRDRKQT